MPTLNWLGKDKVVNYDAHVPFHVLNKKYNFGGTSENKIIHGDNLLALKSLLPIYEGKIKCIYIDPPYNTGNENWIYNDNVNSPQIQKWLGQVVGREGEDYTRHDKWLCMMYPRLKLLKKLLSNDGAIFISIDDNEQANLKLICDEIFGSQNFIIKMPRVTKRGGKSTEIFAKNNDELMIYAKNAVNCKFNPFKHNDAGFKFKDEFFAQRGFYKLNQTLDYDSLQYSDGLDYPLTIDGVIYYPGGSEEKFLERKAGNHKRADWAWRWSPEKFKFGYENGFIIVKKNRNGTRIYTKTYQHATIDIESGKYFIKFTERTAPISSLTLTENEFSNDNATKILTTIFKEKIFDYSKPVSLLEFVCKLATDKNSIVLDSFAGSGTTAHAVLNLNKEDGGNRKFILIELEDYAENITAERVKRIGGNFNFYEVGAKVFIDDELNPNLEAEKLREYIWQTDTHSEYIPQDENFLGVHKNVGYYLTKILDDEFLGKIKARADFLVVYAEACAVDKEFLYEQKIEFRKIPRDIMRYEFAENNFLV